MSEHTLLLCPFGHASKAEAVELTGSPKHDSRSLVGMFGIRCLTCNRVLIRETHTDKIVDPVDKIVLSRKLIEYYYSEDDTWDGTGLMFVDVPDGAEYTEPVPAGQAYNEMADAVNDGRQF